MSSQKCFQPSNWLILVEFRCASDSCRQFMTRKMRCITGTCLSTSMKMSTKAASKQAELDALTAPTTEARLGEMPSLNKNIDWTYFVSCDSTCDILKLQNIQNRYMVSTRISGCDLDAGTCKQCEFAVALCQCGLWSLETSMMAFYAQDVVLDEVRGSGFTAHDRKVLEIMDLPNDFPSWLFSIQDSSHWNVSKASKIPCATFFAIGFQLWCNFEWARNALKSTLPIPSPNLRVSDNIRR